MNEMENQSIVSFQITGRAASCRPDTRHSQDGERSEQQDPARGDGRPARQHRVHRPGDPGADLYTMFHEASTIHIQYSHLEAVTITRLLRLPSNN